MTMSFIALLTLFTVPAFSNLFKINPLFKIGPFKKMIHCHLYCSQVNIYFYTFIFYFNKIF